MALQIHWIYAQDTFKMSLILVYFTYSPTDVLKPLYNLQVRSMACHLIVCLSCVGRNLFKRQILIGIHSQVNGILDSHWPETCRRADTHRASTTPFKMACITTAQAVKQSLTWKLV